MSLLLCVDRALRENRQFDAKKERLTKCMIFDDLMAYLPILFDQVDMQLFDGGIKNFLKKRNIEFAIVESKEGPVGLTVYENEDETMRIYLRSDAWKQEFPALVGGKLCHNSDSCLIDVFLHEMLHVVLFCIYIELDLSSEDVEQLIPYHYDPTHNVLFTVWLERFFGQCTINNSLLLKSNNPEKPLIFTRDLVDTEQTCLVGNANKHQIRLFLRGEMVRAKILETNNHKNIHVLRPHHSRVITEHGLVVTVPNGLLFC